MRFTDKQREIMSLLIRANPDGTFLDIDQLIESLSYRTSKESLQFSIRTLIKHGMVTKAEREIRRARCRTVLVPTGLGYSAFGAGPRSIPELPT